MPRPEFRLTQTVPAMALGLFLSGCLLLSGCVSGDGGDIAHKRSMAELNIKAQKLLESGDVDGAIARLESAHDLEPNNTRTAFNLGVAYQAKGNHPKAIETFTALVGKGGIDQSEVERSLGISCEGQGEALLAQARDEKAKPKPDAALLQAKTDEAVGYFNAAIDHYEKALKGAAKPKELEAQSEALRTRLADPSKLL